MATSKQGQVENNFFFFFFSNITGCRVNNHIYSEGFIVKIVAESAPLSTVQC